MSSIWKDLLFLHGHLVHKEDLAWHPDPAGETERDEANAEKSDATAAGSTAPKRHVLRWPRLAVPH